MIYYPNDYTEQFLLVLKYHDAETMMLAENDATSKKD